MDNGELTPEKAINKIKWYHGPDDGKLVPASELLEYCKAITYIESLMKDITGSMDWMVETLKLQIKAIQFPNEDALQVPDERVSYSPELSKAIEVLEKLKEPEEKIDHEENGHEEDLGDTRLGRPGLM